MATNDHACASRTGGVGQVSHCGAWLLTAMRGAVRVARTGCLLAAIVTAMFGMARGDGANGKSTRDDPSTRQATAELDKVHAVYERDSDANIVGVLLAGDGVTDETLVYLKALPRLEKVEIRCAKNVDDRGLASIGELSAIKVLWLEYLPITDQGVAHLGKLANLEDLFLGPYKSSLGDSGLAQLGGLTSLRSITLTRHAQVTDDGVGKLRAELPNCKIERRREVK